MENHAKLHGAEAEQFGCGETQNIPTPPEHGASNQRQRGGGVGRRLQFFSNVRWSSGIASQDIKSRCLARCLQIRS